MYGGTRLGRQELDGVLLSDLPGQLWTIEILERCRTVAGTDPFDRLPMPPDAVLPPFLQQQWPVPTPRGAEPRFTCIAIGVDPPVEGGTCGIIACALDHDGIGHVLADHSIGAASPEGWARKVAEAAALYPDALIVAEVNQGGRMVESVLRTAGPGAGAALRIKPVRARHGKSARAEPVAMLFEQGRVRLHGRFPEMEAELMGMIAGGGYQGPGASPDRADAMVWALIELLVRPRREPSVAQL